MSSYLICEGEIDPIELHCPTGWVVVEHYTLQDAMRLIDAAPLLLVCALCFVLVYLVIYACKRR